MKKVLYISNIEVPYRTEFFNKLAEKTDLTVVYERKKSSNRDNTWAKSQKPNFKVEFLRGINYKNEYTIDLNIIKLIKNNNYDCIILGCYNSISQIILNYYMRIKKIKFLINIDGEYFITNGIKGWLKRQILKGAVGYLVAGKTVASKFKRIIKNNNVFCYKFSSLTKKEIEQNKQLINNSNSNTILIVGQYEEYKGLDIVLDIAKYYPQFRFKFIGTGKKTVEFNKIIKKKNVDNITTIPFMNKVLLNKEYQNCKCLILPSRKECWGLVINEAASFGTPIISTLGSGAAVEFLIDKYALFLAKPGNINSLKNTMDVFLKYEYKKEYKDFLLKKTEQYTIEENVDKYVSVIDKLF